MAWAITALSIILIIAIIIIVNLLRKLEATEEYVQELEDANVKYYQFIRDLKLRVTESHSELKQVDRIGAFEASDEVGFAFKDIKRIFDDLNNFFTWME